MNPKARYILIGLGILAVFALVATLITLTLPKTEVSGPKLMPTNTSLPMPTVMETATSTVKPTVKVTPAASTATTAVPVLTPVPVASLTGQPDMTQIALTLRSQTLIPKAGSLAPSVPGGNGLPRIEEKTYTLPKGLAPSDGAESCPSPLPLAQIRSDYLAYWDAVQKAHKEVNFDILKPYLDPSSRDGKYLVDEKGKVDDMQKNGYYIEYQIIHSDPLRVKINPLSHINCYLLVMDGAQVTATAKKINTNEPFNDKQPVKYTYPPDHGYMMTVRNGHWVVSGEGADTDQ